MVHSGLWASYRGRSGVDIKRWSLSTIRSSPWLLVALSCGLLLTAPSLAGPDLLPDITAAIDAGQFADSEARIAAALADPQTSSGQREALLFQRERMRRILLDFTLSEDDLKTRVREQIPDLSDTEFGAWNNAGLFERQVIDGRTLYFQRAPSNLYRLSTQARDRRKVPKPIVDGPMEAANAHHVEVRDAALSEQRSNVAPRRLRVTQSLTVNAGAVPDGKTIRAWIPYPRAIRGQQEDLRFVASEPAQHTVAPESTLQRTVFLEKRAKSGSPTRSSLPYGYLIPK